MDGFFIALIVIGERERLEMELELPFFTEYLTRLYHDTKCGMVYGCVLLWAYMGIALKHLSPEEFNGKYPSVIITIGISILLLILAEVLLITIRIKEKRSR